VTLKYNVSQHLPHRHCESEERAVLALKLLDAVDKVNTIYFTFGFTQGSEITIS